MSDDVFRKNYRKLTSNEQAFIETLKETAEDLYSLFKVNDVDLKRDPRCISLAITNLEQSIFWAVKSVTG